MPEQIQIGHDPQGRPVYAEVLSAEEIRDRMLESPEWKRFSERFDMSVPGNVTLLNAVFGDQTGPDSDLSDYTTLLNDLFAAGGVVEIDGTQYEFELAAAQEPEPEVPTDRNGRPLSEAQMRWSEYREFSESHSMKECRERARTDAGFNSFMTKNLQREMAGGVGDEVENLNQRNQPAPVTEELKAFAAEYHRTPTEKLRQLKRADTNPFGFKKWNENFDAAVTAGLI
jgi:hypothetical protein